MPPCLVQVESRVTPVRFCFLARVHSLCTKLQHARLTRQRPGCWLNYLTCHVIRFEPYDWSREEYLINIMINLGTIHVGKKGTTWGRRHLAPGLLLKRQKDALPQDLEAARFVFGLFQSLWIWLAPSAQHCREACIISERYEYHNI